MLGEELECKRELYVALSLVFKGVGKILVIEKLAI